ncbi:MAG: hypothetical protein IH936_02690 [Acidobacteria bacterium]|nr:hypothetical protein [Acidobacteriota bacterium]
MNELTESRQSASPDLGVRASGARAGDEAVQEVEEVPHQLLDRVEGLTCPHCGGTPDVRSGLRVVFCEFCRTRI